jgi:hypothetical protein
VAGVRIGSCRIAGICLALLLHAGVARHFHHLFPNSELFLLLTARHFPQLDEPEEVARLILSAPLARRVGSATGTSTASEARGRDGGASTST